MRDVVEDVEPRDALRLEHLGGVGLRLLHDGRQDVTGAHLVLPGALDVQHGGLKHAAERQRLGRLTGPVPAAEGLERAEELVQRAPQRRQVRPAGGQDALALGLVGERVQQVLQRKVRMAPGRGLPVCDVENQLQ